MGDVKFIRKNGRIIPIRGGKSAGGDLRNKKSALLKQSAKHDRALAKTGDRVANVASVGAAAGLAIGAFRKNPAALLGGAVLGFVAMTNRGFAHGRRMGAKDYEHYAKQVKAGKKVTKRGGLQVAATERAYNSAKFIEKDSGRHTKYLYNKFVKNRTGV